MSFHLLPFAKRVFDGQFVSAAEVSRGAACNCVCPDCGVALIAKQGTEREWHFAHTKGSNCAEGYEKSVHEFAKQLLRKRRLLLLPEVIAEVSATDAFGQRQTEKEELSESMKVCLDDCWSSQSWGGVTPDLTGVRRDRHILIEVTVSHRLMPDKHERLRATALPVVQIDLGVFKVLRASKERLEQELFEKPSNWQWVSHPKLEEARTKASRRLDERLAKIKLQHDEEQQKRPVVSPNPSPKVGAGVLQKNFAPDPIWRSTLPSRDKIEQAGNSLVSRLGYDVKSLLERLYAIKTRKDLEEIKPPEFASILGTEFGISEREIMSFLAEADFVLVF
ncbi:MAG TPA: competence protein CoiA family protein [Halothiobacillus sp.]|nr:competence protein CoiA family protein [Halothiobacillus sp.]